MEAATIKTGLELATYKKEGTRKQLREILQATFCLLMPSKHAENAAPTASAVAHRPTQEKKVYLLRQVVKVTAVTLHCPSVRFTEHLLQ